MEQICPQCNHKIPQGNDNCNLCGFDYKKYLQDKAKGQTQTPNPALAIVPLISLALTFAAVAVFFLFQNLGNISPEKILQIVGYLPFILPFIIITFIGIVLFVITVNQNKK